LFFKISQAAFYHSTFSVVITAHFVLCRCTLKCPGDNELSEGS